MDAKECIKHREKIIVKVTVIGALVNLLLVVFKFAAGILAHSAAMIADATHSLSDFLSDAVVLCLVRISGKPQDKAYDYGYGKFETLATTVIGLLLMAVAVGIIFDSGLRIAAWLKGEALVVPGSLALWAALLSILLKELTYQYTIVQGRAVRSDALKANAWHHRSDALTSVAAAVGIGGAILLGEKWAVLDPLASLVVGAFIVKVALSLLRDGVSELMEKSLPEEVEAEILHIVLSFDDISDPHHLRTRKIGSSYAIELHVRMDGDISLRQAHARACDIEHALKARFGSQTHVSIHVEPTKPSTRP